MAQYSKVIDTMRCAEFKRATAANRCVLAVSCYLLLKNAKRLSNRQTRRLDDLLVANSTLNGVYVLKEQLHQLWQRPYGFAAMGQGLDSGRDLAEATGLVPMKCHPTGICNCAEHPITTTRLEDGHVAIGLTRKRARGLLDTVYSSSRFGRVP